MNKIDLKNTILFIKSYTTAPAASSGNPDVLYTVEFGEGNLQWTINKNVDYELDRGRLDDVRAGDEAPMDISFEGKYNYILHNTGSFGSTLDEILGGVYLGEVNHGERALDGSLEPWLTYDGGTLVGCPPYAVDLELHNNPKLACPDATITGEATLFRFFRATSIGHDVNAAQISVSGQANILQPMNRRVAFTYSTIATAAVETGWAADPRG